VPDDDEQTTPSPLDAVEALNSMRNMASLIRAFYVGLVEEGFDAAEAMRLTVAWVVGAAGGKAA
jgi:hypothetical protein